MMSQGRRANPPDRRVRAARPAETTCDAFLGGRLKVHQSRSGPRAGIDAVFLAAAVPAEQGRGEHALDAGTGCGVVALALASRVGDLRVTGLELQGELCRLAERNAVVNRLQGRVRVVESDMDAPRAQLEALGLALESFDHVLANPPYHTEGLGRKPRVPAKTRAHMAEAGALGRWIRFLTAMAAPHGSLTLIHRADALADLLAQLEGRFGAVIVYPLFPHKGEPASRIIVQGIKGSRAPLKLSAGMVLHDAQGRYTRVADAILREGRALPLAC